MLLDDNEILKYQIKLGLNYISDLMDNPDTEIESEWQCRYSTSGEGSYKITIKVEKQDD